MPLCTRVNDLYRKILAVFIINLTIIIRKCPPVKLRFILFDYSKKTDASTRLLLSQSPYFFVHLMCSQVGFVSYLTCVEWDVIALSQHLKMSSCANKKSLFDLLQIGNYIQVSSRNTELNDASEEDVNRLAVISYIRFQVMFAQNNCFLLHKM